MPDQTSPNIMAPNHLCSVLTLWLYRCWLLIIFLSIEVIAVLEFDKCPARFGIMLFESGQRSGQYVHPWRRQRFKVTRPVWPAAAARQPGAEMNETHGMSSPEGILISWLIPGYASLAILNILSWVILGNPNLQNLYRDILGYPDLPRVSFFQMDPLPWLARVGSRMVGEAHTPATVSHLPSVEPICRTQSRRRPAPCPAAGTARRGGQARNTPYWPGQALLRCSCWLVRAWRSQIFQFGQELRPALRGRVRAARVTQLCSLCCRCSKHFKRRRP